MGQERNAKLGRWWKKWTKETDTGITVWDLNINWHTCIDVEAVQTTTALWHRWVRCSLRRICCFTFFQLLLFIASDFKSDLLYTASILICVGTDYINIDRNDHVRRDGSNLGWMKNKSGLLFWVCIKTHTKNSRPQSWKCLYPLLIALTSHRQCCLLSHCDHPLSRYSRVYYFRPSSKLSYDVAYDSLSNSSL